METSTSVETGRPVLPTLLSPARHILRGVSQIFFVEHAGSGTLILLGLALLDPRFSALVLLGSAAQTLAGRAVGRHEDARHGLMGYNGALVGAAAALHTGHTVTSVLLTICGSFACVTVHELLRTLFTGRMLNRFSLPVATAPFCVVAGLIFGAVGQLADPLPLTTAADAPTGLVLGAANSFSEVLLADGLWCGLVIVLALLVASPTAAAFGAGGAVMALAAAVGVYGMEEASSGLYGYSAVLVAVAFGSLLWTDRSGWTRVLGALAGVLLTLLIQPVLTLTPVPVFTWPFLLAMWLVLIGTRLLSPGERPVTARTPERTAVEPTDDTGEHA